MTANLYGSDSKFSDSQLWQINKSSGYNGQNLQFVYWSNFDGDINFTLLPVSYGLNNTYGPGAYIVASESAQGNKIGLYDLTDDLGNNPEMIYYEITVPAYEVGSDAFQRGTTCKLSINDCRALSGFYLNGIVHFVHAAKRPDEWNGIHYYRVNVGNRTATKGSFGLEDYDYAYPSIASYATTTTGKSAMIKFARSAADDYPETRVVHVDDNFNWSGSTYVKGLWEVECFSGNDVQRWGDYSGICRNYSMNAPSVLVAGAHGNFDGEWESHAAEVHDSGPVANRDVKDEVKLVVWPNPVQKRISFTFQAPETGLAKVICTSEDGTIIKELLKSTAQLGENTFSMNTEGLVSGVYILSIVQNQQILANEKIVIQH
ncbi:MAG: T9SS type A sorting domain-containing protein [Saprospiraceae bacterium]|nr:T9SS type A sorting domain-containing protein [Saprospiraceae bacterium]